MKSLERRRDYCNIPVFSIPHGLVALILNNAGTEKFVINFSSEKEGGGGEKRRAQVAKFSQNLLALHCIFDVSNLFL